MASLMSLALRASLFLLLCIVAAGCDNGGIAVGAGGSGGAGGTGGGSSVASSPVVTSVVFDGPTSGVFLNGSIAIFFNRPMDRASFSSSTFIVSTGGNPVAGTISADEEVALFTPAAALAPNTTYRVSLSPGIRSSSGASLVPFVTDFTTGTGSDTVAPAVVSSNPSPGSTNVNAGSVSITFSEPIDPTSLTTGNISISGPGGVVQSTVTRTPETAVVTPATPLAASTTYTVTITNGVKDLAGNRLSSGISFAFSTGSIVAPSVPQVTFVSPVENAVGVPLATHVVAVFSEAVDPSTISGSTFTLASPGGGVTGVLSTDGEVVTFTPSESLLPFTVYRATVSRDIKNLAGVQLAASKTWSFTTGTATGTPSGPQAVTITPENGAIGVPIAGPLIAVTFDRAIDPASVSPFTVTLAFSGTPVQVTLSTTGSVVRLTPLGPLQANTVYTVTLTTGVRDTGGNPLTVPLSWNFTTARF